ncbi:DUF3408 domain-containing protein [Hymenobacter sp. GOD-10R]|uniref:DUF3408 domain-containing protein n=1 Tax=Hymenobacter sp. GOD-10R TaxID=3093922 RepID=UPI002D7914D5|nr:DUF3408 domain-containing protein [Hymenobacter sp. GOD-10R]WRQ31962.1 DUF3408 domain-containing protein [Hymenobacter sp. GOD-10R]
MATKNDSPDVNAFVNSFKRKPQPAIPAPAEPEPETVTGTDVDSTAMEVAIETPAPPAPVERPAIQKQTGRKEQPAEQEERADYASFLEPVRTRKGKAVYVDEDTHNALSVIANAGSGALSDLLINIVNHHFETHGPDIRAFLNDREKQKKKRLPY